MLAFGIRAAALTAELAVMGVFVGIGFTTIVLDRGSLTVDVR
jgi:hypothetical protein